MNKKEKFIYDRTLREIFQNVPKGIIKILTNKEAVEVLETKFPKVEQKEADIVVRLEDNAIFHLELQLSNDKNMPLRMLYYALLIKNVHKDFPLQMVLYLGEDKENIPSGTDTKYLQYKYLVGYIKDINCELLINSDDINDNILAILCDVKDIQKLLDRLVKKLQSLNEKKKEDYIRKLIYLFRLRPKLYAKITKEIKEELKMPFVIQKEIDPFYKEGVEKGIQQGIKQGIQKEKISIAKRLLDILDDDIIAKKVGLSLEEVRKLRKKDN